MSDREDQAPPRLFRAAGLRCAVVSERIVMLDLEAGVYDVTDEVGAAMWTQLIRDPSERDIPGVAGRYGAAPTVVEADFLAFAATQVAAGRLVPEPPEEPAPRPGHTRRRRPSILRALSERVSADRDLRRGFACAYARRTGSPADTSAPRVDLGRLVARFRAAENLYPAPDAPQDCLPRSLALTRYLRGAGWPAQHVIGVALYPFEAHAWVEVDGAPLNESDAFLRRFTVIQRA